MHARHETRRAISRVLAVKRDPEVSAEKAILELTASIEDLGRTRSVFYLAQAFAIRGTAFARGMEDHVASFRDWRIALRMLSRSRRPSRRSLRLQAWIRVQMAFHSEGPARRRLYGLALRDYRAARDFRGISMALVHRGLEWKDYGDRRRALRDLLKGLAIAREHRVPGVLELRAMIADASR